MDSCGHHHLKGSSFYSGEKTLGTRPLMSTSVLLFLTQASRPRVPFSTPSAVCFHPPALISGRLSPLVFTHVIFASILAITLWARLRSWVICLPRDPMRCCLIELWLRRQCSMSRRSSQDRKIYSRTTFYRVVAIRENRRLDPVISFKALHVFGFLWSTVQQFCAIIRYAMFDEHRTFL